MQEEQAPIYVDIGFNLFGKPNTHAKLHMAYSGFFICITLDILQL